MERKDYNNLVKSMQLSNHWYYVEESDMANLRYGLFVPSNENIIEIMDSEGYFLLAEFIKGLEYSKNVPLLYIISEFFLAKWKKYNRNLKANETFYYKDDLEECLYSSLQTMYRLIKNGEISWEDPRITRFLQDLKENANIEKCQAVLNALLKSIGCNIELSEAAIDFIENEEKRIKEIENITKAYKNKYMYYNSDFLLPINFLSDSLKEGIIAIQSDGTVKSPLIDEESSFQFDPDVIFMLDEDTQACILKEGIDEGKIIMMDGLDFLKTTSSNVKKL